MHANLLVSHSLTSRTTVMARMQSERCTDVNSWDVSSVLRRLVDAVVAEEETEVGTEEETEEEETDTIAEDVATEKET